MRSIIDGLPPRSGDRIFPKTEQVFGLATSPPNFFSGGVVHPNTAQLARLDRAPPSKPLSLAVCRIALFPSNPLGWCELTVSGRVCFSNRVSWVGCWCLICAENGERPPNSGGEFRRALCRAGACWG